MEDFYSFFPRQLAFPYRVICHTKEEFYKSVNAYNGIKERLYASLYNCNEIGKFENPFIDKIPFDFDLKDDKNKHELVSKLIKTNEMLTDLNIKHLFQFSTKGFWLFVFTKNYEKIKYHKSAMKEAQTYIANICDLSIGNPSDSDIDFHIIGDVCRISRIFNVYDTERKLYAIPICLEDLEQGYEYIKEKARKQNFVFTYYGSKYLDLKLYDKIPQTEFVIDMPYNEQEFYGENINTEIEKYPPCIQRMINDDDWKGWFYATLYMKEIEGLSQNEVKTIMKAFLSVKCKETHKRWGNDYNHYREHDSFPNVIYQKDLDFPKCNTIYNAIWNTNKDGTKRYCKGKCKFFMSFYKTNKKEEEELGDSK